MARRLNTHRKLALIMLACAILLAVGGINAAMAQSSSYIYETINPLDDPDVLAAAIEFAVLKPIGDQLVDDIAADLIRNLPRDAMSLKLAVDQQRFYLSTIRQAQVANGIPVTAPNSMALLVPGLGLVGGVFYWRWRRKHPARRPIWAWRGRQ